MTLRSQVREELRQRIHRGEWRTGDRLPSENDLIKAHGVSRITVRQALADLASDGMIVRVQGKGSFVSPAVVQQELSSLQGLAEALALQGKAVHTQVLSWQRVRPGAAQRLALGLKPNQSCMELQTLRFVDEKPLSYNCTWLDVAVARGINKGMLESSDLLTLYEQVKGMRVASASLEIRSTLASQQQADLLNLNLPAAVLQVDKSVYNYEHKPLHYECSIYHSDMFSYRMGLSR